MLQLTEAEQNSGYTIASVAMTIKSSDATGIKCTISSSDVTRIVELQVSTGKPVIIVNGALRVAVDSIADNVVSGELVKTIETTGE